MKIYVVIIGDYDSHYVWGTFSSIENAHAALIDWNEAKLDTTGPNWDIIGDNGDYLEIIETTLDE